MPRLSVEALDGTSVKVYMQRGTGGNPIPINEYLKEISWEDSDSTYDNKYLGESRTKMVQNIAHGTGNFIARKTADAAKWFYDWKYKIKNDLRRIVVYEDDLGVDKPQVNIDAIPRAVNNGMPMDGEQTLSIPFEIHDLDHTVQTTATPPTPAPGP